MITWHSIRPRTNRRIPGAARRDHPRSACGPSKASAPPPTISTRRFTAGAPKASAPPTSLKPRRFSKSWHESACGQGSQSCLLVAAPYGLTVMMKPHPSWGVAAAHAPARRAVDIIEPSARERTEPEFGLHTSRPKLRLDGFYHAQSAHHELDRIRPPSRTRSPRSSGFRSHRSARPRTCSLHPAAGIAVGPSLPWRQAADRP
jgi:hypothetical protein